MNPLLILIPTLNIALKRIHNKNDYCTCVHKKYSSFEFILTQRITMIYGYNYSASAKTPPVGWYVKGVLI